MDPAEDAARPADLGGAALKFEVLATDGRARATRLTLRHHDCRTPMFMPVGTQGKYFLCPCEELARNVSLNPYLKTLEANPCTLAGLSVQVPSKVSLRNSWRWGESPPQK
jgi:hypothetical protein